MNNKRLIYIDVLKFVLSIFVLFRHFELYFNSGCTNEVFLNSGIIIFLKYIIRPFLNGGLLVTLFCIVSGYLSSNKKIYTLKQLLFEIVIRYIKLVTLVIISNCFVILIQEAFGFQCNNYAIENDNSILLGLYFEKKTLINAILTSFRFSSKINNPVWMLDFMFIGDVAVLVKCYLTYKFKNVKRLYINIFLLTILLLYAYLRTNIIYSIFVFFGSCIVESKKELSIKKILIIFAVLLMLNYCAMLMCDNFFKTFLNSQIYMFMSAYIIIAILVNCQELHLVCEKIKNIDKLHLGEVSMWIYLLHIPIICSFSFSLYYAIDISFDFLFWLILLITLCITIVISYSMRYIYNSTINKLFISIKKNIYIKINL